MRDGWRFLLNHASARLSGGGHVANLTGQVSSLNRAVDPSSRFRCRRGPLVSIAIPLWHCGLNCVPWEDSVPLFEGGMYSHLCLAQVNRTRDTKGKKGQNS